MADVWVPPGEQPSWIRYSVKTAAAIVVVSAIVATFAAAAPNAGATFTFAAVGTVLNVGILFRMVQSLIGEWLDAAELIGDRDE